LPVSYSSNHLRVSSSVSTVCTLTTPVVLHEVRACVTKHNKKPSCR